jgi:hypothetical protein
MPLDDTLICSAFYPFSDSSDRLETSLRLVPNWLAKLDRALAISSLLLLFCQFPISLERSMELQKHCNDFSKQLETLLKTLFQRMQAPDI